MEDIGNAKEAVELSDEELYPDESEFVTKALEYSRTEPAGLEGRGGIGMAKD